MKVGFVSLGCSKNLIDTEVTIGIFKQNNFEIVNDPKEADIIVAEDTRHSLKLLNHLEISKPLISYHRHNEDVKTDILINKLLEDKNIALITDAGTPGISDPGEAVVKEAIKNNIKIVPIPGACALINALIASGIDATEFAFLGFLALNKKNRKEQLDKIKNANLTTIIYEAPHKLLSTLKDLSEILEDRKVVLARELTKIHEEFIYGTANELLNKLDNPKGEFVIIIDKAEKIENEDINFLNNLSVEEHYNFYQKQGMEKNEIIKKIAKDRNVKKNEIYKLFI